MLQARVSGSPIQLQFIDHHLSMIFQLSPLDTPVSLLQISEKPNCRSLVHCGITSSNSPLPQTSNRSKLGPDPSIRAQNPDRSSSVVKASCFCNLSSVLSASVDPCYAYSQLLRSFHTKARHDVVIAVDLKFIYRIQSNAQAAAYCGVSDEYLSIYHRVDICAPTLKFEQNWLPLP
jgi:hypothetical protein